MGKFFSSPSLKFSFPAPLLKFSFPTPRWNLLFPPPWWNFLFQPPVEIFFSNPIPEENFLFKRKLRIFGSPIHQGHIIGILWDPKIFYPITVLSSTWCDDDDDSAPSIVDNGPAATITWEKQIKGYFWLQFFEHTCYHGNVDFDTRWWEIPDHI